MLDYPFDTMNLYTPGQTFSVTHDFFCVLVYIKRVCFTVNEIYFDEVTAKTFDQDCIFKDNESRFVSCSIFLE